MKALWILFVLLAASIPDPALSEQQHRVITAKYAVAGFPKLELIRNSFLMVDVEHVKFSTRSKNRDRLQGTENIQHLIECLSSFARLRRESVISTRDEDQLRMMLGKLSAAWTEIQPANDLRVTAGQLLLRHPLCAADSIQLAAALLWCNSAPQDHEFVCLDSRLHAAARVEGFTMLPSFLS